MFAGNRRYDTHARRGQPQCDVVAEGDYFAQLDAGRRQDFKHRNDRPFADSGNFGFYFKFVKRFF